MVQCYYKNDDNPNLIQSINSGVCEGSGSAAGFFSCCFPWDTCLPDGICYTNTTYYTALCTDSTLQDASCQHGCGGLYRTGLRYSDASADWICCNKDNPTCSTGTNATFNAPAPQQLLTQTRTIVDFIPSSTPTSTSTSQATSSTSSASSNASGSTVSSHEERTGLSTGAKAGIGIGAAVLVMALLAGLVFWLLRRKNSARSASAPHTSAPPAWVSEVKGNYTQPPVYEADDRTWPVEADSSTSGSVYSKPQQRVHEMG